MNIFHLIDTIGTIDDLIENYQKQLEKIKRIGLLKINKLNDSEAKEPILNICTFQKGFEIGSRQYSDKKTNNKIQFIRVGDLASGTAVFVEPSAKLKTCKNDDILIAFDGAPGRIGTGFNGAYSSGLQRVVCKEKYKGLIYFELLSNLNQKIISDNSQGTTILHASRSIDFLCYAEPANYDDFNNLFLKIISLQGILSCLKKEKGILLKRYFG